MKNFGDWLKENRGINLPEGNINGSWFAENGLPMVVSCTCCGSTMCVVNAMIDEEGQTFCGHCVGVD